MTADPKLRFDVEGTDGGARAGVVHLPRGSFQTPVFMPVGTRGAVRSLTAADLESLGAEIILGNTYHLMLRPGSSLIAGFGGLHGFEDWHGRILTDSGGFQVFSLDPKVDDSGVLFKSVYDGMRVHFSPERAVEVQEELGSDIAMLLDVCAPLPSSDRTLREAVERTLLWAAVQRKVHHREDQVQFGIVQGGTNHALRAECAQRIVEIGFDAYAIGGLSVGETRDEMLPTISATTEHLPPNLPRYLMGVGDPISLIEGVARGIDMFDCVLPTRLARHGTVLTSMGRIPIKNARFARSDEPLDPACGCMTCRRHSRGYLRHLISVGEQTAATLLTVHNLTYLLSLMRQARQAILGGTFDTLRIHIGEVWRDAPGPGSAS